MHKKRFLWVFVLLALCLALPINAAPDGPQEGQTYYVSSSEGNDDNDGKSSDAAFATIDKVNDLELQPGDSVLFKCGDVWRADPLILTRSGTAGATLTYSSYPADCADKPVFSGAQPISGWALHSGNIYVADLNAGANAGKFAYGVNQLFTDDARLPFGRWPNLDEGDGGYTTIDAQPSGRRITDNELSGDWTGAIAHIRGMRWYILNREVVGTSGTTLNLNADAGCWGSDCTGWGYFLNNHLATLDLDGEWYYDAATHRVYIVQTAGAPGDDIIFGSVVLRDDGRAWGGIVLGEDLGDEIAHIHIENIVVRRWYKHGISTPTNLRNYENSYLTITGCDITDVDGTGLNLATWVYDAYDGANGWRGGNNITLSHLLIDGANQRGIDTFARYLTLSDSVVRNVGRIENLGAAGLGCSLTASGGSCTEDGDGIRIKVGNAAESGHHHTLTRNRVETIAYNGIDVFGHNNTFTHNVIQDACYTKGDCGGVRTFGNNNLSTTLVHDLTFTENIILNAIGNTAGCHPTYQPQFGFGLYFDNGSANINATNNTIIDSTAAGLLYQRSTGTASGNVLYNNSRGTMWSSQVALSGSQTRVNLYNNVWYAFQETARTLAGERVHILAADGNAYFHPYIDKHINVDGAKTLADWQASSGLDGQSWESWFSLEEGEAPRSQIFYNDTAIAKNVDLGNTRYVDLRQQAVSSPLVLAPFTSQVLVAEGGLADLALTMASSAPSVLASGTPLTYTLSLSNQGTVTATQVVLTNTLPALITSPAWTASSSLAGIVARSGDAFVWDVPNLAPGAMGTIMVTGALTDSGETNILLNIRAEVQTPDQETTLLNNQDGLNLGDWQKIYLPLVIRGGM